ncbi:arginine--tRNA ligase [Malacoplasma penetrans]|uniref:arginine--tRNA ligase n=1 Tax=Malacoplasma penetrans TaxID=28227 RepID=UPI0010115E1D|nr:arginine--tRNA ligase [Malacoplasma penetrans]RXY96942.1 arginine--tRNA ligase [Malacoplasma penetrans]
MIKTTIIASIKDLIKDAVKDKFKITIDLNDFVVDKAKSIEFGDFYSNVAMILASKLKKNPILIAEEICQYLKNHKTNLFESTEAVKPGYINVFLSNSVKSDLFKQINKDKDTYGIFEPKKVAYNIEFVSANPTGSLHIGHARNAALGQTLGNVWKAYGYTIEQEYYINDGGNQINNLGMSVFYRYLQKCGKDVQMEEDFYQGSEPIAVAELIYKEHKDKFVNVKYSATKIEDEKVFDFFRDFSKTELMNIIKKDLKDFSVHFDRYFPESKIYEMKLVDPTIKKLGKYVYEKDGALWLKTTEFGDDKDRVIVKSDKSFTYFMPDIAYHDIKATRTINGLKTDKIFNIWGADHASYVDRMTVALQCLGFKKDIMHVIVMQMVKLTKNGKEFKMSKRSGNSLTLRDLINAIGVDNSRWELISQAAESHIEIDVEKFTSADSTSNLSYVLYAYSRIQKILEKNESLLKESKSYNTDLLTNLKEKDMIAMLFYYPQTIANIAKSYEVHKIPIFLYTLANLLHSYYSEVKIIDESNKELLIQRLHLLQCVNQVIKNGLKLLDIEAKVLNK